MSKNTALNKKTIFTVQKEKSVRIEWMPWDIENDVPFKSSSRVRGPGEEKLVKELNILGYDAKLAVGNIAHDIVSEDFGSIQVKAPDKSGMINTGKDGYTTLSTLINDCLFICSSYSKLLLDDLDGDFADKIINAKSDLMKGTFNLSVFDTVYTAVEVLNVFSKDIDNKFKNEWVLDPSLFVSDCICVFASNCIQSDNVALVCDSGYAIFDKNKIDNILIFKGSAWNGKPKFCCDNAVIKKRKEEINKRKNIDICDKITLIEACKNNELKKER